MPFIITRAATLLSASVLLLGCTGLSDGTDPGSGVYTGASSGANIPAADRLPPASPQEYRLPWTCGESYVVTQGNSGDECGIVGNHQGVENFAWDFGVPLKTPILAVRAGTVTLAAMYSPPGSECYDGCPNDKGGSGLEQEACCSRCLYSANRVNVQHEDGVVSSYSHLSEVAVTTGQMVKAGQLLGYSGTSGCSTGPHMHFQVMFGCPSGYCQSLPLAFDDAAVPACGDRPVSQNNCS